MTELEKAVEEILTDYGGKLERVAQHALKGIVYDEPNPNGIPMKQALLTLIQAEVRKARIEELENLHDTHFWDTGDCTELHNRINQLSAYEGKE